MKKLVPFIAFLFLGMQFVSAQPSGAAPTPPAYGAGKVISIYSDAFTNVTGTDFNPWWGQTTVVSFQQIAGNNTMVYTNLNYQGTQFQGSVNALPMTHLHLDVWTANETSLQITPISSNPTKEFLVACTPLTLNTWNSVNIPLSSFTGVDMSNIFQFKVVGSGGKTVYIDNLYFYNNDPTPDTQAPTGFTASKGTVTADAVTLLLNATDNSGAVNYEITYGTTTLVVGGVSGTQKSYTISGLTPGTNYSFSITAKDLTGNTATNSPIVVNATTLAPIPASPVPPQAAANVISIYSDKYGDRATMDFWPNWGQPTVQENVKLADNTNAKKFSSFTYQGMQDLNNHINAASMTYLHIDIYPTTETHINLTPISQTPQAENPTSLGTLTPNKWNSFDVPLTTYTGVNMADVFQFKLDGGTGGTFYLDNLYFHNNILLGLNTSKSENVKCYPNPATDKLYISSNITISEIIIQNTLGQTVLRVKNYSGAGIDVSQINTGNYILIVKNNNDLTYTSKFMKI